MLCCMDGRAQVAVGGCGLTGFANYRDLGLNGTTGGGQGQVVRVQTREQLEQYAKGTTPYVIIIEKDLEGDLVSQKHDVIEVGSNKTIVGAGAGVTLNKLGFDVKNQQNLIFRNLKITNANPDALAFRTTHHVWVDHCDLSSCDDGLLDFTIGSSYLTVSWTKFSNHDKVSICNSGTEHFEDYGKERATYHHCRFVDTTQRNPRFGYGLGHVFNNYYNNNSSYCVGYHTRAKVVVENSLFSNTKNPLNQMYSTFSEDAHYADVLSKNNVYKSVDGNTSDTGVGFDIDRYYDYAFAMSTASEVESVVESMGLADGVEKYIIPFPGDGAIDVLKDYKLQCGAIENATKYTYYIGKSGASASGYSVYDASSTVLQPDETYQWYAVVTTPDANYTSDTFRFSTASAKASKPTPVDGDTHASLREALTDGKPLTPLMLRWRSAFDAASYRVYLCEGATVGDDDFIGETDDTEIAPGALKYGQRYSWRVDAVTSTGDVITGDVWTFSSDKTEIGLGRTELETSVRNGIAFIEQEASYRTYSGGYAVCGEAGPGSMSMVWSEQDTRCNITTTFFDWQKKNGTYTLYVNEESVDAWVAAVDGKNMFTHVSENISLKQGDELRIEFCTDGKMRMRTDCIDIVKASASGIDDINAGDNHRTVRIYTMDGRYVGNRIEGLPKGVYIVNGKKVAI